jgi:NAD(P)-dependent dehydrogenase (short-subunit alcohol dehydrogenase family)
MNITDIDLAGQVALVTGGGGGIGSAIALCLADMGADIAVLEVIPERCEQMAALVAARGRRCLTFPIDVKDVDKVDTAVEETSRHFGRLDILVNNAGGAARRNFTELSEKNWRRNIDFNLVSVLAVTSAAVPIMIAGGRGGSIINVTSIEGSRGAPGYSVYAACKAGLNNLTRTLALEFAEHRIRVNAIAPDYIVTPGTRGNFSGPVDESQWVVPDPGNNESARRRIPLGHAGVAEECGKAAVFLASRMASYVTGVILPIDGGSWASCGWIRDAKDDWILPPEVND